MNHERRQHDRQPAEIACKIRCGRTGRYLGAMTSDVSAGGAMLTVQTPTAIRDGETVEMALRTDGLPIVRRNELVRARVVRCSALMDRHQVVAVRFDAEQAGLNAAPRAAAA